MVRIVASAPQSDRVRVFTHPLHELLDRVELLFGRSNDQLLLIGIDRKTRCGLHRFVLEQRIDGRLHLVRIGRCEGEDFQRSWRGSELLDRFLDHRDLGCRTGNEQLLVDGVVLDRRTGCVLKEIFDGVL